MTDNNGENTGRDNRGRFASGNGGRPRGAKNKRPAIDGKSPSDIRKLRDVLWDCAFAGDVQAIRLILAYFGPPPRGVFVKLEVPEDLGSVGQCASAIDAAIHQCADGLIDIGSAKQFIDMCHVRLQISELVELEERLSKLEENLAR